MHDAQKSGKEEEQTVLRKELELLKSQMAQLTQEAKDDQDHISILKLEKQNLQNDYTKQIMQLEDKLTSQSVELFRLQDMMKRKDQTIQQLQSYQDQFSSV